jgi:hypothetical protein
MYVCYYRNRHDIDRSHDSIKILLKIDMSMIDHMTV